MGFTWLEDKEKKYSLWIENVGSPRDRFFGCNDTFKTCCIRYLASMHLQFQIGYAVYDDYEHTQLQWKGT